MHAHSIRSRAIPRFVGACLLLTLACGTAIAQATAAPPVARTFSDWSLTCDNLRSCVAMSADEDDRRLVVISRAAGPDAAPTVEVVGGPLVLGRGAGHGTVRYPASAWVTDAAEVDETEILRTSDLAAVQAFVDAIRNADVLRAQSDAADEVSVSLKGISAALLLMDEVQGRLGTRGALLRRGAADESKVPAAPSIPSLTHAPAPPPLDAAAATALAAAVRKAQHGELETQDCDRDAKLDEAWPLTDKQALVYLGCWMGAYQGSGLLFIVERKAPHAARRLVLDNPATGTGVEMVTTASYDPATATLDHFGKGRGLGDCGESAAWVFDGTRFNLARYASMDACAGLLSDRWPTRWRTQEATR